MLTGLLMPNNTASISWLSVRDLAERLNVTPTNVSAIMKKAEASGVGVIRNPEGRVLAVNANQFIEWWENWPERRKGKTQALGETEDL